MWAHYRQIQEAALPTGSDQQQDQYPPLVLRTFTWGFPHQHQAPAPPGKSGVARLGFALQLVTVRWLGTFRTIR